MHGNTGVVVWRNCDRIVQQLGIIGIERIEVNLKNSYIILTAEETFTVFFCLIPRLEAGGCHEHLTPGNSDSRWPIAHTGHRDERGEVC